MNPCKPTVVWWNETSGFWTSSSLVMNLDAWRILWMFGRYCKYCKYCRYTVDTVDGSMDRWIDILSHGSYKPTSLIFSWGITTVPFFWLVTGHYPSMNGMSHWVGDWGLPRGDHLRWVGSCECSAYQCLRYNLVLTQKIVSGWKKSRTRNGNREVAMKHYR